MNTPGYESLAEVLHRAYNQAASGKGAERHACSRPFTEQPMQSISALLGNETGLLYQAMKKIQESQRMDQDAAIRELLGAINYIAGAIIFKEGKQGLLQFPRSGAMKAAWDFEQATAGVAADDPRRIMSERASQHAISALSAHAMSKLSRLAEEGIAAAQQTGLEAARIFKGFAETHWLCYHGNTDVPGKPVRIGEACPLCFATSN